MTTSTHLTWAAAALGLAACSDGGGDPVVPDSARFTELAAQAESLYDEYYETSYGVDLPASGSATFEGAAAFATKSEVEDVIAGLLDDEGYIPHRDEIVLKNPSMVSDVTLTADFGSNAVEGRLHDFEGAGGVEIDGELAITDGQIDRNRAEFQADLGGTLNVDGVDVTYSDGPFVGVYGYLYGEGVQALSGSTASVATSAAGEEVVYGVFTAVR